MLQANIIQISNGFLVAHPSQEQILTPDGPQMGPPVTKYCVDINEVCAYLKQLAS